MGETKKLTDKYRLEQWAAIIRERINSGKQVKEWCAENNISRHKYFYWLRKVKSAAVQEKALIKSPDQPVIVPLMPPQPIYEASHSGPAIILNLNGIVVEIQECASDAIIERTLKVIQRIC